MKALLLIVMSLPLLLKGQTIQNTNFENWHIVSYNVLANWKTSNEITIPQYGAPNVTKLSPGITNSSLRLATIAVGPDTVIGYITNASCLASKDGGIPYTQHPTGLQGDFRYNIAPGDTARILVSFKHSGIVFASDMISLCGMQQSFVQKNFPLPVMAASGLTPDSVVISITSGDFMYSPAAGSYIEMDNLVFTGQGITQGFNGDFDNWQQSSFDDLPDWAPSGTVCQTNDAICGNYAATLISKNDGIVIEPAVIQQHFVPSKTIDTLTGWYKYASKAPDSASIEIYFINPGVPSATITHYLPNTASYTQFKMPLTGAIGATVKAKILIRSSCGAMVSDSSILIIDSLVIKRQALDISGASANRDLQIYPNPAADVLKIAVNETASRAEVAIFNSAGSKVYAATSPIRSGETAIPVSQLSVGIYLYEVRVGSEIYKGKFVKE